MTQCIFGQGPRAVSYSIWPNFESILATTMYNWQLYFCTLIKTWHSVHLYTINDIYHKTVNPCWIRLHQRVRQVESIKLQNDTVSLKFFQLITFIPRMTCLNWGNFWSSLYFRAAQNIYVSLYAVISHDVINLPKTHYYMVRLIYLEYIAYKFKDLNNYMLGLGVFFVTKVLSGNHLNTWNCNVCSIKLGTNVLRLHKILV